MFTLTETEISDFLAGIEIGWVKPIPAANSKCTDSYGEIFQEITFYRLDKQVFCAIYYNRTTETVYKEVVGEDLELFNIHYGEG